MAQRTALVFPGQGSQRPGMLLDVPETDDLPRLLDAAEALSGLDLRRIEMHGTEDELADTRVAQPLLYLAEWAWGRALLDSGLAPSFVAGHSLGELTALAIAGTYSVEAGLELVIERSRLMAEAAVANPGSMAAVLGFSRAQVQDVIADVQGVWVANDNAPAQVVITGTHEGVACASERLSSLGARRVVPLKVSGAFHSPLMSSAQAAFARLLDQTDFSDATIPVLQNVEPLPTRDAAVIRERLMRQISSPVRWTETMAALAALAADGPVIVVEAGPGSVLTGLIKRVDGIAGVSVEASGIEAVMSEVLAQ